MFGDGEYGHGICSCCCNGMVIAVVRFIVELTTTLRSLGFLVVEKIVFAGTIAKGPQSSVLRKHP